MGHPLKGRQAHGLRRTNCSFLIDHDILTDSVSYEEQEAERAGGQVQTISVFRSVSLVLENEKRPVTTMTVSIIDTNGGILTVFSKLRNNNNADIIGMQKKAIRQHSGDGNSANCDEKIQRSENGAVLLRINQ